MRRLAVMGLGAVVAAVATGLVLWGLQAREPRAERRGPARAA